MRALVKRRREPAAVDVVDVEDPVAGAGELLVRTEACGLCGSDVHAWRQDTGYDWVAAPVVLGHEAVGRVVGVGAGVDPRWMGRRLVPVSIDGCRTCAMCRREQGQLCRSRSVLGLSFDGAAAELFVVSASRAVEVPDTLPATVLALVEPLSVAARAVSHLGLKREDGPRRVVVTGPGPIGLMASLLLAGQGHEVALGGVVRDLATRLPLAASLGVATYLPAELAALEPPHAWLEASGSATALSAACRSVAPGATVVVPGLFTSSPMLDANRLVRDEIRLQGSYGSLRPDYATAVSALSQDESAWAALVTEVPLNRAVRALQLTASGDLVKAVLVLPG